MREDYLQQPQEDTKAPTLVPLDEDASNVTTGRAPERPRRDTLPQGHEALDDPSTVAGGGGDPVTGGDFDENHEDSTTGSTLPLSDDDLEPGTDG